MTVGELLSRTTAAELTEWAAYFLVERELQEEQRRQDELEREARQGAQDIRRQLRSR